MNVQRALTKAETAKLVALPDLPPAALAILAAACEVPDKAPLALGPERGVWFRAKCSAIESAQALQADMRWGREQVMVQVPASWATYRDRTGKVRKGNTVQSVPREFYWPGRSLPAGCKLLGDARRA
jgi:hypothetical protein